MDTQGDFNEVHQPEYREGRGPFNQAGVEEFNRAVRGLIEFDTVSDGFYVDKQEWVAAHTITTGPDLW